MIFFIFALIALIAWSGSDLFSKMGTTQKDNNSQWRVIFAVGVIMGLHAVITIIGGTFIDEETTPSIILTLFYTDFEIIDFVRYLPVAVIYLSAMVVGYMGLRYIELSVSSPICNSSGSLALVICAILGIATINVVSIVGVVFISVGILCLGFIEYFEDDEIKVLRQDKSHFKYSKSLIAILIPIIYLVLDALGTVGDQFIANKEIFEISDYASNTAFELTSLCFAIFAVIYVKLIKKEKFFIDYSKTNGENSAVGFDKYMIFGGICETIGQIFYMSVMFSNFSAGMPMISSYCALSVIWSRIFLKEKLSYKHYIAIALTFVGIVILGVFSEV